jgi:Nucleotidyltransferase domain.
MRQFLWPFCMGHRPEEATEHSDIDLAVVFDEALSSVEQTRARLSLIKQLSVSLGTDAVDVTPLLRTSHTLRREIYRDGIVVCRSEKSFPAVDDHTQDQPTHADRMARFDELLTDTERVV